MHCLQLVFQETGEWRLSGHCGISTASSRANWSLSLAYSPNPLLPLPQCHRATVAWRETETERERKGAAVDQDGSTSTVQTHDKTPPRTREKSPAQDVLPASLPNTDKHVRLRPTATTAAAATSGTTAVETRAGLPQCSSRINAGQASQIEREERLGKSFN